MAAGSAAGYPSPPAPQGPSTAILNRRIWASSSFLRHYDEAQILLKSQPQICAIGADGGHAVYRRQVGGTMFRGIPWHSRFQDFPAGRTDLDRTSVVSGQSVYVRVDLGSRRIMKQNN